MAAQDQDKERTPWIAAISVSAALDCWPGRRRPQAWPVQASRADTRFGGSAPAHRRRRSRRITPPDGYYIHTYYDVCPFSPSGRYLATTRLPYQDRVPVLGDTAEVCVIDLQEQTIQPVYVTKCWGFQTGSNCQWGAVDHHLYANDIFDGRAVCVRIDLATGDVRRYGGPLYSIAPDESAAVAFRWS